MTKPGTTRGAIVGKHRRAETASLYPYFFTAGQRPYPQLSTGDVPRALSAEPSYPQQTTEVIIIIKEIK